MSTRSLFAFPYDSLTLLNLLSPRFFYRYLVSSPTSTPSHPVSVPSFPTLVLASARARSRIKTCGDDCWVACSGHPLSQVYFSQSIMGRFVCLCVYGGEGGGEVSSITRLTVLAVLNCFMRPDNLVNDQFVRCASGIGHLERTSRRSMERLTNQNQLTDRRGPV